MDTDSQPQTFFAGNFRHSIDEKNRLTIPSRWRRGEAEEFILLPEPQSQCLLVMSPEAFARMNIELERNTELAARDKRVFLRQLHARAQHGAADKQGRLVLPDDVCQQLGLKGEVELIGGRGRFEIWNPARWKQAHKEQKATFHRIADQVGL